jgi:hypothetical protein
MCGVGVGCRAVAGADWLYGFAGESYGGAGAGGRGWGDVLGVACADEGAAEIGQEIAMQLGIFVVVTVRFDLIGFYGLTFGEI